MEEAPPAKRRRLSNTSIALATTSPGNVDDEQLAREVKAGITSFVDPEAKGFSGVLKQRYTDFLVNEILPDGRVLHLTALTVPRRPQQQVTAGKEVEYGAQEGNKPKRHVQEGVVGPQNGAVDTTDNASNGKTGDVKMETDSEAIPAEVQRQNDALVETVAGESNGVGAKISEEDTANLKTIFGEESFNHLVSLYEAILRNPSKKPKDFRPVTTSIIPDKDVRTQAHQAVRKIFFSKLETKTNDDETIHVTASYISSKSQAPRGGDRGNNNSSAPRVKNKLGWEELGGEYLHFTLYKENKDTMEAIYFLASQLKVSIKHFQFGGTKDRRGVTVQRASAYRVHAEQMAAVGKRLRGSRVGDYQYRPNGLELGELGGNEFLITLRDCQFPGEEGLGMTERVEHARSVISRSFSSFEHRGFINYYGLQRFGSFATGTDTIGTKLLQGDLAGAIADILSYSPSALASSASDPTLISSDDRARATAIHTWHETHDANLALANLPRKFSAESNLIRHLGFRERRTNALSRLTDHQGALQTIPRNLRLMYVHAYQSLVWNAVAGARWEQYGGGVVEGDLVLIPPPSTADTVQPTVDEAGEPIVLPAAHDSASTDFERARPLSAEEAGSGKYSICDIVLPLPGFDVVYPSNDIGKVYETFMASEKGGRLDPHDMRRSWKDVSLSGSYRKVLAKPGQGVEWDVKVYQGEDQLVETDLEKLEGGKRRMGWNADVGVNGGKVETEAPGSGEEASGVEGVVEAEPEANKIAIVLKMRLGSSQYATMALRELMKKGGVRTYKPDYGGGR